MSVEGYLVPGVLELLRFRVRGSAVSSLAKRLGTSEEELSYILESMVEDGKLVKKGRYYRLPTVVREIPVELPAAPCHRILMRFSGLRVSWDAVERLRTIIENLMTFSRQMFACMHSVWVDQFFNNFRHFCDALLQLSHVFPQVCVLQFNSRQPGFKFNARA